MLSYVYYILIVVVYIINRILSLYYDRIIKIYASYTKDILNIYGRYIRRRA